MTRRLIVDPPSGWRYGFPKIVPNGEEPTKEWFVKNGYPQKEIDSYGDYFYHRSWYKDDKED